MCVLVVLFFSFQIIFSLLFFRQRKSDQSTELQSMPDGEGSGGADGITACGTRFPATTSSSFAGPSSSVHGEGVETGSGALKAGKDPRKIARKYVISTYLRISPLFFAPESYF